MSTYNPYALPMDPLLGGGLSTGPTGLGGVSVNGLGAQTLRSLPYANPLGSLLTGPAAPRLPYTGAALSDVATLRPITSSLAPMAGETRLAAQLGKAAAGTGFKFNPGGLGMGSLAMRGVGGLAAGQVGSSLIDQLNIGGQNSNAEQGLQGAAMGAGVGAALGAPLFGIGAVPGALLGGAAGGAIGVLSNIFGGGGGDKAPEPVEVLATAMQQARLSPDEEEMILQTYETQLALAGSLEGDDKKAAEEAALNQAGQMVLALMQQRQQQQQMAAQQSGPSMLALQQQAQQVFEPIAQDIETNAGLYAQAMGGIRGNLPASYQSVSDAQVARELTSANTLANAYRAQAALTPVVDRLTQYQQDQNAFASQLFQQMQAQQAAAMAGGGLTTGGTTSDLLTQLAG